MMRLAGYIRRQFSHDYKSNLFHFWKKDPSSVPPEWNAHFSAHGAGSAPGAPGSDSLLVSAYSLIRCFKFRGHELAQIDPLKLNNSKQFGKKGDAVSSAKEIERILSHQGAADLDTPITFPPEALLLSGFLSRQPTWTLRELRAELEKIYSGRSGYQFMHLQSPEEIGWLVGQIERLQQSDASVDSKRQILKYITRIEAFNHFLNDKFKTSKRFGVEGLDSFVAGLNSLVEEAAGAGVKHIDFGMAHRGRLCTLATLFEKPMEEIFAEFQELKSGQLEWGNSGDVKYHLGVVSERTVNGKTIRLSILPNPSHLEAVNPVVMGSSKATQVLLGDHDGSQAFNVIIHGDAALAGQGVVYQSLQMMSLQNFTTYGTIHVVANNQIGFTTTPIEARTGTYCTDVAKAIGAPIFHVNADDPVLVDRIMRLALQFRNKFKKDVFVDIIGYRRYGHNEQDQPAFTQPIMYKAIETHPKVYDLFVAQLVREGVVTQAEAKTLWDSEIHKMQNSYSLAKKETFNVKDYSIKPFHSAVEPTGIGKLKDTCVPPDRIRELAAKIFTIPPTFNIHPQIAKIFDLRRQAVAKGEGIDFGTAEALAFGSLIGQGFRVRVSGQDVERGTFSHRHAMLIDQKVDKRYCIFEPLLQGDASRCQINNSFLSQYGCLGFEYGYSLCDPNSLVVWEAQFGDFANGGQVIIDNFIASAETKWNIQSGIVLNMPHGMDGQGPEHSSGRIERFLSLTDQSLEALDLDKPVKKQVLLSNMQVIVPSFAANYFHALRRQMRRDYRKPLVSFNSKKLLRFKKACSVIAELDNKRFLTCLPETQSEKLVPVDKVRKVLICAGQVYYDLEEARDVAKVNDVAIVRVEQLAPFPFDHFKKVVAPYKNARFQWVQEQHKNSGGWEFVEERINLVLQNLAKNGALSKPSKVKYVGRKASASTSTGSKKVHDQELRDLLAQAFL